MSGICSDLGIMNDQPFAIPNNLPKMNIANAAPIYIYKRGVPLAKIL